MIEPHVVHGGASSWFCIAANGEDGTTARVGVTVAVTFSAAEGFGTGISTAGAVTGRSAASSRLLTPARYCASGDRNFDAIHRKM
jgi:hypothetical protein